MVAQLRRGGTPVTGRWCQQVHELHRTGVLLVDLHMGEDRQ
jgi:hypothetical protein